MERKQVHDAQFLKGQIGEPTYIVSLGILGFTDREANDALRELKAKR